MKFIDATVYGRIFRARRKLKGYIGRDMRDTYFKDIRVHGQLQIRFAYLPPLPSRSIVVCI